MISGQKELAEWKTPQGVDQGLAYGCSDKELGMPA
jgi:hypothetical protein